MPPRSPIRPGRQVVRVVLSATALLSFMSVWKAAALAIAELGVGAFFVVGLARALAGDWAPWVVLAAGVLSLLARAADIESWALFIPGGLIGRVEHAFGPRASPLTAAAMLVERLVLAALACVLVGHHVSDFVVAAIAGWPATARLTSEEVAGVLAVVLLGVLWLRARMGQALSSRLVARGVWVGVGILTGVVAWAAVTVVRHHIPLDAVVPFAAPAMGRVGWWPADAALTLLVTLAIAVPLLGGGDALARSAHEYQPPRIQALRRTGTIVSIYTLAVAVPLAFLYSVLVPSSAQALWFATPLAGLGQHLAGPPWARGIAGILIAVTAVLLLLPAAHAALADAEGLLRRLGSTHRLAERLALQHPRFGTYAYASDLAAAATVVIMLAGGGRVPWIAHAYAVGVGVTLLIRLTSLVRLRTRVPGPRPYRVPLNVRLGRLRVAAGLVLVPVLASAALLALIAVGDPPAIVTFALVGGVVLVLTLSPRLAEPDVSSEDVDTFELLPSPELAVGQVEARPGNLLVAVRHPHSLSHVAAALQAAGDRDVVVMTARLLGVDVEDDGSAHPEPTASERRLLSRVVALAERYHRPVHLLIVPAQTVFDALVTTITRLRSSELYVGESSLLSADDQARLLGDAWEQAEKPEGLDVRLVIHHHSGRDDAYHIGAHPPALTPGDLDLIHRVWLDAVKAIGPHVHHHDVVRAALTQMEQQLSGPQRDEALGTIRQVARPADELAAAVHQRDFSRLRDMVRNRHAGDLAAVLTELAIEDQVVVFRVLPRKDAAAVFEYLAHEDQEALLKAMAQEDIAALLNNMAPDDRTMFLEELPATATRQLLSLLTPAERSVAVTLLGYPEDSIGRLMTPEYVGVREHWTVREVLDYIREHGQDSETLNVVYVVDEQGLLIDDIRIRELLLTPLDKPLSDLMDRRFVALKATDDQATAVAAFRAYDRSALPVTDTTGMLIGIVTIDDVLDVAEAEATKDIQRIGGSEALDEPYMDIGFGSMIRKRAGWLTALFLGEMLTATAMSAFEHEISQALVLALFVPLIISSGGNSGSQASTLVIRALALGEVGLRDWWRVVRREIFAGIALGTILGSIGFLRITLTSAFLDAYGPHSLLLAITVGLSLVGVVLWGTMVGSLLPFILRRLGFDPATSSAPFVATLVDVTGLVIYFSVALVVLRGTLL
jgi:magnesium transporter